MLYFYLSETRDTNLIDPIPAYAGMTRKCGRSARRHIALDCHSRTPTFSTLIVLLRNDRGESARAITKQNAHRPHRAPRKHSLRGWFWRGVACGARRGVEVICPAHMRGQHLHSKLYTLHSTLYYSRAHAGITSLCAQRNKCPVFTAPSILCHERRQRLCCPRPRYRTKSGRLFYPRPRT